MLKKVDVQEVAQAATEGAPRSAAVDAACAAKIQALVRRAQTRCRPALAVRRMD
ncbi:MAG: hypothetical protein VB137_14325 [Burkholderia sp.]